MLRSFDGFAKPVDGLRSSSTVGGVITLVASASAFVLFVSQLFLYARVETRQFFQMAESMTSSYLPRTNHIALSPSKFDPTNKYKTGKAGKLTPRMEEMLGRRQKLPISFHVTFPHIQCADLEVTHDDAGGEDFAKMHGRDAYVKRRPTKADIKEANMSMKSGIYREGCSIQGKIYVPKVGGMFSITVTRSSWTAAVETSLKLSGLKMVVEKPENLPNVSHYIHSIEFGERFPLSVNPLEAARHEIEDESGLGIANVVVKLIPTKYKRFARRPVDMYQVSVTDHMVHPNALALARSPLLPGLVVSYDFTPLAVHHTEYRENIFSFLSSLVSIVGGAFVTVGLVSRFLVSAASVAKKKD